MTRLMEIESAIYQLPRQDIQQLVAKLLSYLMTEQRGVVTEDARQSVLATLDLLQPKDEASVSNSLGLPDTKDFKYNPTAMTIWEIAAEFAAGVPEEEWDKIPTDLSKNFDFYQQQSQKNNE